MIAQDGLVPRTCTQPHTSTYTQRETPRLQAPGGGRGLTPCNPPCGALSRTEMHSLQGGGRSGSRGVPPPDITASQSIRLAGWPRPASRACLSRDHVSRSGLGAAWRGLRGGRGQPREHERCREAARDPSSCSHATSPAAEPMTAPLPLDERSSTRGARRTKYEFQRREPTGEAGEVVPHVRYK